ncbi:hypothetical protein TWF694_007230 [Orbilia ellipsospora]|uniref:CFEM domain-containing protein n=1 Tax=Orbilia ellipsospora TaxID=2528407 RepID=A0AAV9XH38_9PEZI
MRPLLLFSVFAFAIAQFPWQNGPGGMSTCSRQCFISNLGGSGCSFGQFSCVCGNQALIQNLTACVSNCNATEAAQMPGSFSALCHALSAGTSANSGGTTSFITSTSNSAVAVQSTLPLTSISTTSSAPHTPNPTDATQTEAHTPIGTSPSTGSNGSTTPIGPIVGGVVGGFGGTALILAMVWLILREKNKGDRIKALPPLKSSPPRNIYQIEEASQSIWDGREAYKWNPSKKTTTAPAELPGPEAAELPGS